ncbi:hypothetical protein EW146_g6879 [Bondarzewia mesenterica]|uniref:Translation initiation factor 3 N-terminal domain-containing protein n=1 Tax=Bondarzewia mesenterica TaxID=1095465 RepID=A0A4S4LMA6_9AGAM|nr:hypothetical protein EW146_g6879 [Bondarzewia mesenterica]
MAFQLLRASSLFRLQAVPLLITPTCASIPQPTRRHASTGRPRNQNIKYETVRVVDPETRKPTDPQPYKDLLKAVKAEHKYFIELVAAPSDATGGYPLVKLISQREDAQRAKEMRQKQRLGRKHAAQKEVQLTWSVEQADWDHKLRKVREEIGKGYRADLVFALKSGQQPPKPREMEDKVSQALEALQDVAIEWQPQEKGKNTVVVHLQDKGRPLPPKSVMRRASSGDTSSSPTYTSEPPLSE